MRGRRPKHGAFSQCQDLLEIAKLMSWCINRNYLINTCLEHVSQTLGKRARCVVINGDGAIPYYWTGKLSFHLEQIPVRKESIVRSILERLEREVSINLADTHEAEPGKAKIEAVIPLWYVDPVTQEEKKVGALIIETRKKGEILSSGDLDYLQAAGELIGAALGKADLAEQMTGLYKTTEAVARETAHAFRNRIAAMGGFSQHIARLAKDTSLAEEARVLHGEVQLLESHVKRFEKLILVFRGEA